MIKKVAKAILLLVIVSMIGLVVFQVPRNGPKAIISSLYKAGFSGENKKFVFQVKLFGLIPAGEAVLSEASDKNLNGRDVLCITAQAYPSAFISRIYKVRVQVKSLIDKQNQLPVLFTQQLEMQNKPSDNKEVYYDQKKNIMTLRGEERAILADTYDPLSAVRFLRNQDFNKFKEFDININTNQKNYGMKGKVLRREKIVVGGKEYFVWVLQAKIARRDKNNPYHRSQVTLYLLDNAEKTPLMIKVFASGGLIVAVLEKAE
ncbi:MAG: DUF3108 domain-containing protein [Candidatus Omnitrophica bacterium]|nr:DUF3108 domain-containing protein [Candidatus Omnitrophota bacterium]MDD5236610.1 DUF3108 domain-containing protein [Candidatus Omnitrophota bacterium]MDD5610181.1 DUF3108 domain-containing protein [Candidatus Omnitrophota bacterium]